MEKDQVNLVRRRSGGGAVYQDLGNSIFTFLSPSKWYDKERNFKILQNCLSQSFHIPTIVKGRNDMVISSIPNSNNSVVGSGGGGAVNSNGNSSNNNNFDNYEEILKEMNERKISGSAFKQGKNVCFHHGTLLINLNTSALKNYLTPNELKLKSKGVSSVSSRVCNLIELNKNLNHDTWSKQMIFHFIQMYGQKELFLENENFQIENLIKLNEIEFINQNQMKQNEDWLNFYNELKDENWIYGKTPDFNIHIETRFNWGLFDLYLDCKSSKINSVKIYSDCLYPAFIELFELNLKNLNYSLKSLIQFKNLMLNEKLPTLKEFGFDTETIHLFKNYTNDLICWMHKELFEKV
jgi:lipoate-protein ligase A